MNRTGSAWPDERNAHLRRLWLQRSPELSASLIGVRMGVSKNAIVGKAHRLGLPSRPSPIQPPRVGPKPASAPRARPRGVVSPLPVGMGLTGGVALPAAEPPPPPPPVSIAEFRNREGRSCCWPIGEPGTSAFHYCGAGLSTLKRSYCDEHHGISWHKARDRR